MKGIDHSTGLRHPVSFNRRKEDKKHAGHHESGRHPGHQSRQENKDVKLTVEVGYAENKIARSVKDGKPQEWDTVRLRSFNGGLVGPVIEACPGDTLNILLKNRLPPEHQHGEHDPNVPHGFNSTNLHFHGMHVSPSGNSDNVLLAIGPGQEFQYEVKIPSDHPAGTYWYHAHRHGSVALQLASGMAGALIIRGDIDKVPSIRGAREQLFVLQHIHYVLNADGIGEVESYDNFGPGRWEQLRRRTTLNGEVEPTVRMKPGEVQRWRFIHGGVRERIRLKLVRRDPKTGAETPLPQYQIALDGITTGRIEQVLETEMHPGYRADVMVRACDEKGQPLPMGTYWLVDEAITPQDPEDQGRVLARIVVEGREVKMKLPTGEELAPLAPFEPIEDDELTSHEPQQVHFHIDVTKTPPEFQINGKAFDPHDPPRKLALGAVEEWLVSSSEITGHPFHIHVNPFQVMGENGKAVWRDTIFVPAGGSVRLRTRYERYIGTFVIHCHILDHEDQGMMQLLEVVPPGEAHDHALVPDEHGGHRALH